MVEAERNYEIYDKEMLAVIRALEDWRHYLEGLPNTFTIVTDHRNLEYWRTAQNLTRRQARWSLYLSRFDFHLTHKPGTAITQANPLSRISTHQVTDADDNKDRVVLRPDHFADTAAASFEASSTLEQEIRNTTELDAEVTLALRLLKQQAPRQLTEGLTDWEERDGLIFYKGRIYVPKSLSLRKRIVQLCHDSPTAGHPGRRGTQELVGRLYWWPGLTMFVKKYVSGCDTCQRYKPAQHPRSTLQPPTSLMDRGKRWE